MGSLEAMPTASRIVRRLLLSMRSTSGWWVKSKKWVSNPSITVARSDSRRPSTSPASNMVVNTMRAPVTQDISGPSYRPKQWNNGRYMRMTSREDIAMRLAASVTVRIGLWQCITPLGNPVVPDVYISKNVSSGLTVASRRASSEAGTSSAPASIASQSIVPVG